MSAKPRLHGVILADIVSSRKVKNFRLIRDSKLTEISNSQRGTGLIVAPYTVTAWDEFQSVLGSPSDMPDAVFDLRCRFQPLRLRIAVGVGEITEMPQKGEPLNEAATGQAFERARNAMDDLKSSSHKYPLFTRFWFEQGALDLAVNITYRLHDTLLERVTARQWQTILARRASKDQEDAAKLLGVQETSTVSRNLQRGFYWQMQDTRMALRKILADQLPER